MTENGSCKHQKKIRTLFGRRKNRPLKSSQTVLFETLLPILKPDPAQPAPSDIRQLFTNKPEKIILEIGFGGGERLIEQAIAQPETGFIGCEPFINGMGKALAAINKYQIANILPYDEDAGLLLDWLPDSSMDMIYLPYPDPWPKKRHWKRRFVNMDNLNRFARVLKHAGEFRFVSDIDHYVNWTLKHCHNSGLFDWQAKSSSDWKNPWDDWSPTRYEKKALRENRIPAYLTFKKR